jgi:hypothetical protein
MRHDPAMSQRTARGRGSWVSLAVATLVLIGMGLYSAATGGYALWVQHFGTDITVEIVQCNRHTWRWAPTTCKGALQQTDGTQRRVTVHSKVTERRAVDVHIRGDDAYTDSYPGWRDLLIGIAILGLVPILVYGNRRSRTRRPGASGTVDPDPGTGPTSDFLPPQ